MSHQASTAWSHSVTNGTRINNEKGCKQGENDAMIGCDKQFAALDVNGADFKKIQAVLSHHDKTNRIATQICSNLQNDGITVEL